MATVRTHNLPPELELFRAIILQARADAAGKSTNCSANDRHQAREFIKYLRGETHDAG